MTSSLLVIPPLLANIIEKSTRRWSKDTDKIVDSIEVVATYWSVALVSIASLHMDHDVLLPHFLQNVQPN